MFIGLHIKPHGKKCKLAGTHEREHGCQHIDRWDMSKKIPDDNYPPEEKDGGASKEEPYKVEKHQGMKITDNVFFSHSPEKELHQKPANCKYNLSYLNS